VAADDVWSVLMEFAVSGATVTVLAVSDDTTSIYLSSGGGFIGGGAHASVRAAGQAFLAASRDAKSSLTATTEFPLPREGEVRFFVRTGARVGTASVREQDLVSGRHALSALYAAGQQVITAYREMSAKPAP
jgi:hypothetical protein